MREWRLPPFCGLLGLYDALLLQPRSELRAKCHPEHPFFMISCAAMGMTRPIFSTRLRMNVGIERGRWVIEIPVWWY